jgi:hypothetical protein
MADDACVPHVRYAHFLDVVQRLLVEVVHLSTAVLLVASIFFARRVLIAKQACENLIDNWFHGN